MHDSAVQPAAPPADFRQDLTRAFQRLRSALTQALVEVGADPHRARELGRTLGVNKSLAWRATRIVGARDAAEAVPHVPGAQAFATLVDALVRAGLSASGRASLEQAVSAFGEMRQTHSGDRATLEQLAAAATDDPGAKAQLEQARRQAHVGLASTWGVQARVQFLTIVLGPPQPGRDTIDVASLSGLIALSRLRPDARWTLFKRRRLMDDGTLAPPTSAEPLDPDAAPDGPPLISAFTAADLPALEMVQAGAQTRWLLPPGPVGHSAARDVVFGSLSRDAVSVRRAPSNEALRFWIGQTTPVQLSQCDLIVHEGHAWARRPHAILRSQIEGLQGAVNDDNAHPPMPLHEEVHELGQGLSTMASPDVPRYGEMLDLVARRSGWDREAFLGYRLTLPYPPIPTIMALCLDLPDVPAN